MDRKKGRMRLRLFGKHKKMPAMLKCVKCGQKPGEVYHHHLPLCKACASKLHKRIQHDGGALVQELDSLKAVQDDHDIEAISERVIKHASSLIEYEDIRLKTTDPEPSEIIHRVRIGEYSDMEVTLFNEE